MQKFDLQSRRNEGILHKTLYVKSFYSPWNVMAMGKKGFSLHNYLLRTQCKIDFVLFSLKYIWYWIFFMLEKQHKKVSLFVSTLFTSSTRKSMQYIYFWTFPKFFHMLEIFKHYLSTEAVLIRIVGVWLNEKNKAINGISMGKNSIHILIEVRCAKCGLFL